MEALASGTPLITTAAGGIGAVVEDNVTALVVPSGMSGLAAAIQRAWRDARARERIGAAARELVERAVRVGAQAADQFEAAYRRALAFKSTGR